MDRKTIVENPSKLTRTVGICIGVLLIVLEIIIATQYVSLSPKPEVWMIISLTGCFVVLDVLYFVEVFAIKTLMARIAIYAIDFVLLLFINALTGSAYFAGLYAAILTQFYLNVEDNKSKAVALVFSSVMFIVTCVVGWFLNHRRAMGDGEILETAFACLIGIVVLILHFCVTNFLLLFYRNNRKLTAALKEADESKKQLEEAYEKLSETAVFQERNRIARDIHDNAGHSMTAVIMQTEAAKLLIDSHPDEAKAKIISANIQAKNALDQMRESVHLLAGRATPASLKEELEEILAQTMDGSDVKIRFDIADVSLPYDRRRFVCNSLKECLANGVRHGGANAFYVEFGGKEGSVCLTVSDNGSGLPENFKEGFGLRGIREKAANFGGGVVYESESGDGCEIRITIATGSCIKNGADND